MKISVEISQAEFTSMREYQQNINMTVTMFVSVFLVIKSVTGLVVAKFTHEHKHEYI